MLASTRGQAARTFAGSPRRASATAAAAVLCRREAYEAEEEPGAGLDGWELLGIGYKPPSRSGKAPGTSQRSISSRSHPPFAPSTLPSQLRRYSSEATESPPPYATPEGEQTSTASAPTDPPSPPPAPPPPPLPPAPSSFSLVAAHESLSRALLSGSFLDITTELSAHAPVTSESFPFYAVSYVLQLFLRDPVPPPSALSRLRTLREHARQIDALREPSVVELLAESFSHLSAHGEAFQLLREAEKAGLTLSRRPLERIARTMEKDRSFLLAYAVAGMSKSDMSVLLLNVRLECLVAQGRFAQLDTHEFRTYGLAPNQRTFHTLILGHLLNRNLARARTYLSQMRVQGLFDDVKTHLNILIGYRAFGFDEKRERRALQDTAQLGLNANPRVLNALIQLRLDADDVEGALKIYHNYFDHAHLPPPSPARSHSRLPPSASSSPAHPSPSPISFDPASSSSRLPFSSALPSSSIPTPTSVPSDLCHPPHAASARPRPDPATFTTLISICARQRDFPRATLYFNEMARAGFDAAQDERAVAAYVRAHVRTGQAWQAYLRLRAGTLPVSTRAVNSLLRGGLLDELPGLSGINYALQLLRSARLLPDEKTLEYILGHLAQSERLYPTDLARHLVRLVRLSHGGVHINTRHVNTIVKALEDTVEHQRRMPRKARRANVLPPKDILERIMTALQRRGMNDDHMGWALKIRNVAVVEGDLDRARELLRDMTEKGLRATEYQYSALVEGFVARGDFVMAFATLDHARRAGVEPNAVMYGIIAVGYARADRLDAAEDVVERLVRAGMAPTPHTLTAIVRGFLARGMSRIAIRFIQRHPYPEPLSDSARALLFRLYTHAQDHDTARQYRDSIAERRLRDLVEQRGRRGLRGRVEKRRGKRLDRSLAYRRMFAEWERCWSPRMRSTLRPARQVTWRWEGKVGVGGLQWKWIGFKRGKVRWRWVRSRGLDEGATVSTRLRQRRGRWEKEREKVESGSGTENAGTGSNSHSH